MLDSHLSPAGRRYDPSHPTAEPELFSTAMEAWRREHDLWRRRSQRADDQAAALLTVDITALGVLATVTGVVLKEVPYLTIAGAVCLLVALVLAALIRIPAWYVPASERREFNTANRTWSLWPFRSRGERPWSPVSDRLFLSDVGAVPDWTVVDWRRSVLEIERRRTFSLRDQVEKEERSSSTAWPCGSWAL